MHPYYAEEVLSVKDLQDFIGRCVMKYDSGPVRITLPPKMFDKISQEVGWETRLVKTPSVKISSFELYYHGRTVMIEAEKEIE